ncbi:MAG: hypothetical protein QW678_01230 [Candidatus Aenigmatarchaeota archaeon]
MNRIFELMKKGYFVQDPQILSLMDDEEFKKFLLFLPKSNEPRILKKEDVITFLQKIRREISIRIFEPQIKQKISNLDLLNILRERYNFLSSIIKKKLLFFNLLSINKISKKYRTFSLIGMVYEINGKKITIDDLSSKIDIWIEDEEKLKLIEEDCVIGVKCYWKNDEIYVNEVIFPEFEEKNNLEEVKEFRIGIFNKDIDIDVDIVIQLDKENKILKNKVYVNSSFPVHQIYVNNSLILIINLRHVKFNINKFLKLRLVTSKSQEILNFGGDFFLIKNKPSLIITLNSNKEEINKIDDIFLVNLTNLSENNYFIDLKEEKIFKV